MATAYSERYQTSFMATRNDIRRSESSLATTSNRMKWTWDIGLGYALSWTVKTMRRMSSGCESQVSTSVSLFKMERKVADVIGQYASEVEVHAAARMLQRSIRIVHSDVSPPTLLTTYIRLTV